MGTGATNSGRAGANQLGGDLTVADGLSVASMTGTRRVSTTDLPYSPQLVGDEPIRARYFGHTSTASRRVTVSRSKTID